MDRVELAVESRALVGKRVKQLRKQGKVPAVMYGHGFEPVPLQTDAKTLGRLLMHVGGSQLINLQITDQGQSEMALVRDVQRDVLTRSVTHVDFYRVRMTERLKTEIPLEIMGESPMVKDKQGLLLQGISSIEVECLPGDLVDAIRVDVSSLVRVDMSIFVRDLDVPSGIDVLTDADEMIARIVYIAEEEAIEGAEAALPEVAEVEVIRRGKEEEEELPSE